MWDLRGHRVFPGKKVIPEKRVRKVFREYRENRVYKVRKAIREIPVLQVRQEQFLKF